MCKTSRGQVKLQVRVMQVSLRELKVASEPDSSYFLRLDWSGRGLASGFQLLLTDGQEAWRGDVSEASLAAEADELEMQIEHYVHDLQEALTTGGTSYTFSLTPPPGHRPAVTLEYEKVQKDISFRLGSVLLTEVQEPTEAIRDLLVYSLQRGKVLENQNQDLEEENRRLRGEQQRITAQLKLYAGGKEALEAELYSRFVLVLNEKKAKIRSLQEAVSHLQEASTEVKKTKDSVKCDRTEEEEDEYTGSTDEETPAASSSSSQGRRATSPLDDSLNDITDVAPCRKRRFRHLGGAANPEAVKRASCEEPRKKRTDPPPGSSKQPLPPRRPADAASADDLFDDF